MKGLNRRSRAYQGILQLVLKLRRIWHSNVLQGLLDQTSS